MSLALYSKKSLIKDIEALENVLQSRRLKIKKSKSDLRGNVKSKISSPKVLSGAFALGFLIERLTHRPNKNNNSSSQTSYKPPKYSAVQLLGVTYSILNTWPIKRLLVSLQNQFSQREQRKKSARSNHY